MFIPFYSPNEISPVQWLVRAKEYLKAVEILALRDAKNALQASQTAPVLTLLAYAYEQILKSSAQLQEGCFEHSHDLVKLWEETDDSIREKVPVWTQEFIGFNRRIYSEDELSAVLELDPNLGHPNGSFVYNLAVLNNWTWRSLGPEFDDNGRSADNRKFLSRYPQVGMMQDGEVDVLFLFEIGLKIISLVHPKAMEYQKKNFE